MMTCHSVVVQCLQFVNLFSFRLFLKNKIDILRLENQDLGKTQIKSYQGIFGFSESLAEILFLQILSKPTKG